MLGVSVLLSAAGTALTAGLAGVFAYFVLGFEFYQAMLLGAVISSTDAASVFSILRSKNLNLKNNLDSILQIESGSNDPIAYMLTVVFISLATGESQNVALMLILQLAIGAASGFLFALLPTGGHTRKKASPVTILDEVRTLLRKRWIYLSVYGMLYTVGIGAKLTVICHWLGRGRGRVQTLLKASDPL